MRHVLFTLAAASAVAAAAPAVAQVDARMLRHPDVSATHISFVYAGDIWLVPKQGGVAARLSSPPGEESFPRFSPDGDRLAFSANYDGNVDLYVVPVTGGQPLRVTHHPAEDRMLDWTSDGERLLFASSMTSGTGRFNQLWTVSAAGGLPERLPLPYGEFGAIAPDGVTLAYQTITRDFRTWKRYRGGMAPDIWLFDLATGSARNLTDDVANDAQPMWHGRTLYFLSDRGPAMRGNIWAHDLDSGRFRQLTHFTDFDVRFPAIGPEDLVFEAGGELWRLDLATERAVRVEVRVVTDESTLRPRQQSVSSMVENAHLSPSGKRVVVEARGDLFTVPAEHGPIRALTRATSSSAERSPAWSPDGKWIAAWSDATGEYQLVLYPADGRGEPRTLTSFTEGFRYTPFWSPDSSRIAFVDHAQRLWLLEVSSGALAEVDRLIWMSHPGLASFTVDWSADSRWLTYSRAVESDHSVVFLYDVEAARLHPATLPFYDHFGPVFDAEGKYLFLLTNRHFEPAYSDLDGTWIYANLTRIAALPLRADVPSPLAPRNDVEEGKAEEDENEEDTAKDGKGKQKDEEKDSENGGDADDAKEPEPVTIDLEGLESRMVLLPPAAGNYGRLASVSGKLLYLEAPRTGAAEEDDTLKLYDFEERESKDVLAGVDDYLLSADREKVLVVAGDRLAIVDPAPGQKMEKPLRTAELTTVVDPRAEWRQMFSDAWRAQRDFFYDPNMHGVDWLKVREQYGALIEHCVTRWDVNFVLGEMLGELNASHAYRGGGDLETARERGVGLLGVDWELADGRYRIAKIVRGGPWDTDVRSPLDEPGIEVSEGDWVLAVNGVALDPATSPWAAFDGLAGRTVALTVNSRPTLDGAREVLVETLGSEARLRNLAWVEANRRTVEQASGGRVGYVFVPDTGVNGQSELVRQFFAQSTKDGLIVDERFNAGGQWPDRFVELLGRPRTGYVNLRNSPDRWLSGASRLGPTVMLVNSWAGSGGDAFPYLFRRAGLGPIIGTRTWGGLIGISGGFGLVDGGGVTIPTLALYTPEREWMLEGHGLEPDIEVIDDPAIMASGRDPQLERAIAEVERLLEANPIPTMTAPAPGDRTARQ